MTEPLPMAGTKDMPPEEIADPAAWSLDVEEPRPVAQKPRLQMKKAGAGDDEEDDPAESAADS